MRLSNHAFFKFLTFEDLSMHAPGITRSKDYNSFASSTSVILHTFIQLNCEYHLQLAGQIQFLKLDFINFAFLLQKCECATSGLGRGNAGRFDRRLEIERARHRCAGQREQERCWVAHVAPPWSATCARPHRGRGDAARRRLVVAATEPPRIAGHGNCAQGLFWSRGRSCEATECAGFILRILVRPSPAP